MIPFPKPEETSFSEKPKLSHYGEKVHLGNRPAGASDCPSVLPSIIEKLTNTGIWTQECYTRTIF